MRWKSINNSEGLWTPRSCAFFLTKRNCKDSKLVSCGVPAKQVPTHNYSVLKFGCQEVWSIAHAEMNNHWLVVCLPLWKIWKSVGMIIPIYGKIIQMSQTTNQINMNKQRIRRLIMVDHLKTPVPRNGRQASLLACCGYTLLQATPDSVHLLDLSGNWASKNFMIHHILYLHHWKIIILDCLTPTRKVRPFGDDSHIYI